MFATVDADPAKKQYGSRRHHVLARFENPSPAAGMAGMFDVVILNGVVGFVMNTVDSKRAAFSVSRELLAPRGRLLIGYNDLEERNRFAPEFAKGFETSPIPGMQVCNCVNSDGLRFRFVCFVKADS